MRYAVSGISILILTATTAFAAPDSDFVVMKAHINAVTEPKGIRDLLEDCAKNPACRAIADAVATNAGVPPGTVSAVALTLDKSGENEDAEFHLKLPSGYVYCGMSVTFKSVVPNTGDRASLMYGGSREDGAVLHTWTPVLSKEEGRSWVDTEVTLTGVKRDKAEKYRQEGKCKSYPRQLVNCRGGKGVNKGTPACASFNDG